MRRRRAAGWLAGGWLVACLHQLLLRLRRLFRHRRRWQARISLGNCMMALTRLNMQAQAYFKDPGLVVRWGGWAAALRWAGRGLVPGWLAAGLGCGPVGNNPRQGPGRQAAAAQQPAPPCRSRLLGPHARAGPLWPAARVGAVVDDVHVVRGWGGSAALCCRLVRLQGWPRQVAAPSCRYAAALPS